MNIEEPPVPKTAKGFFTDTSLCIGCKACEVACKQWNQLPADGFAMTGNSYDNTGALGATTWRHVQFIEQAKANGHGPEQRWLMMSDVCKHCANAACLEACPTGALVRTEYGTVYVQQDICNGCGFCVPACPFGVIDRTPTDGHFEPGTAHKCTLCYDRLKDDMTPACAKSCPTASIQFGEIDELRERARRRLGELPALPPPVGAGGVPAFFGGGGLGGGCLSPPLAGAGFGQKGRPPVRRRWLLSGCGSAGSLCAAPDRGPRQARALSPHAPHLQAALADEPRRLDPDGVHPAGFRARRRPRRRDRPAAGSARRTHPPDP